MADSRYLDGDPNEVYTTAFDLSEFVQVTAQECQLIADLIEADRADDARAHATIRARRAYTILRTLEREPLPEVDVERTPDTANRADWRFKSATP